MRVLRFGAVALGFSGLLVTLTLIGCAGGGKEDPKADGGKTDGGKTTTTEKAKPMMAGKGTFKGMVKLTGDKPDIAGLNSELKTLMEKLDATQKPTCFDKAPQAEKDQQDWKIGENDGVADVFVFFKPASGHFFAFEAGDEAVKAAKKDPIQLDQPHCAFIPHALIGFAGYRSKDNKLVPTEQKLIVHNNSDIAHNTKIGDSSNDTIGVKSQLEVPLTASYNPVLISCKVHPFMSATLLALEHPYAAKTNEKGEFEIKNVPAGKVMVIVWHPKAGYVNAGAGKGEEIELKDGETTKNFDLKAKK